MIRASRLQIKITPGLEIRRKLPFPVVLRSAQLRVSLRLTTHNDEMTFTFPVCSCLAFSRDYGVAGFVGLCQFIPGRSGPCFHLCLLQSCFVQRQVPAQEPCRAAVLLLETVETPSPLPNGNLFRKQISLELYCFICSTVFTVPARIIPH